MLNVFASWKTTFIGLGLIASAIGAVMTDLGNGMTIMELVKTPEFGRLLGGVLGILAKDYNVTSVK